MQCSLPGRLNVETARERILYDLIRDEPLGANDSLVKRNRPQNPNNLAEGGKGDGTAAIIIAIVVLIAAGIVAVTWFLIGTLQETSHSLRTNQVKPQQPLHDMEIIKVGDEFEALATKNKHPKVDNLNKQAIVLVGKGKYTEAVATMKESVRVLKAEIGTAQPTPVERSQFGWSYWYIGDLYFGLHNKGEALSYANQAIEADPAKSEAYKLRARIYDTEGKHDLAQRDIEKVRALDANFVDSKGLAGSFATHLSGRQ
jgi:tetratricopeptide (TPR) repeat protein